MKRQSQPSPAEHIPYSPDVTNKLEERNWRTIVELHKAQESIERIATLNAQLSMQNTELSTRLEKILERNPNIWEFDDILVTLSPKQSNTKIIIQNFYIGKLHLPEVCIEASSDDKSLIIHGLSNFNESSLGYRFTSERSTAVELRLADTPGSNPGISQLSTTEWFILVSLLKMLTYTASTRKAPLESINFALFLALLEEWPAVLRYDTIENLGILTEGKYSGLAASIKNISFDRFNWPELNFRLATVSSNHLFFQYPRLEFPESTTNSFENWYSETTDHKGSRLELRYAHPRDIDASVWNRLSKKDKCLVTALVYFLPSLVTQLGASSKLQPCHQWYALAECIKNIHVSHIRNNGL